MLKRQIIINNNKLIVLTQVAGAGILNSYTPILTISFNNDEAILDLTEIAQNHYKIPCPLSTSGKVFWILDCLTRQNNTDMHQITNQFLNHEFTDQNAMFNFTNEGSNEATLRQEDINQEVIIY